ncbi:piwi-like protein 1 [Haliotis rufescens]|uniref:piwi-like protein 1 n=1 Tax=Haliotis rufescens TaxID=6454 RepID=UPI00201EB151|nr:piwi-like protein 1 [Haliotis rufescens]
MGVWLAELLVAEKQRANLLVEKVSFNGVDVVYSREAAAAPPPPAGAGAGPPPASGRASYRGGAKEPRPGMAGEVPRPPIEEIASMSIGTGDASEVGRKRSDFRYTDLNTRPAHIADKKGTSGRPMPVLANFFRLETAPDWMLYQYHVDFNPTIDSRRLKNALLMSHIESLLGNTRAFDGMILYLPRKLPQQTTEVYSNRNYDSAQIRITITLTNELPPTSPQFIQVANILFRKYLSMINMKQIGRHYFNPTLSIDIPRHKYNNKTYRVDDIDWDKNPLDTFKMSDGSQITYKEYYKKSYEITVTDDKQPLLVSKPKKSDIRRGQTEPIYLLPELCTLTGLSEEVRADFNVMKDVATHTCIGPEGRSKQLTAFINQLNAEPKIAEDMRGWKLRFQPQLLPIQARVVPQEKIRQGRDAEVHYKQEDADWSRDMRGKHLLVPVSLENWVVLSTQRDSPLAQDLVQTLGRVGPPMGMNFSKPLMCQLQNDRNETYLQYLRQNITEHTQMVICLCPNNKKDRYDAIKKFCCVEHPVPSQVVVARTVSKKQMLMSVATKIAIQLNCKLGGEVWAVEIPLNYTMVVGIDTYYDSARKGRSVAGVVASVNKNLTRYYSKCTFQFSHQELIDGLRTSFTGAFKKFHEVNNTLPEKIIVYRDGVGDGQLPAVYEHEVPQMIQAI